mmetsp:Transcript_9361/g.33135  ORF Transcript_9361/g.33135 Transcript_9361/m.33135 type:complete len:201 (-) Transcript_9361:1308-1910(-)
MVCSLLVPMAATILPQLLPSHPVLLLPRLLLLMLPLRPPLPQTRRPPPRTRLVMHTRQDFGQHWFVFISGEASTRRCRMSSASPTATQATVPSTFGQLWVRSTPCLPRQQCPGWPARSTPVQPCSGRSEGCQQVLSVPWMESSSPWMLLLQRERGGVALRRGSRRSCGSRWRPVMWKLPGLSHFDMVAQIRRCGRGFGGR